MKDYILQQFGRAGIDIKPEQAELFLKYYQLLIEWNEKFNLTAITQFEDVVIKHFVDSCAGAYLIRQGAMLCDVGSGAGFPALPLKIIRADLQVTMMDSVNKKVTFLNMVAAELGLTDCIGLHIRAEDAARGAHRAKYDCVTARAVAPLNSLCEYALPLVKTGGVFMAYKGDAREEIRSSANAIKLLGGKLSESALFTLDDGSISRSIVVITKLRETDAKYPRGKGKERSNPL